MFFFLNISVFYFKMCFYGAVKVPKFDCFVIFCVKIFTLPHCGGLSIVNRPRMLHTQAGCFFFYFFVCTIWVIPVPNVLFFLYMWG